MIRHLLVFLLAGACCHQAAQGAVTVYQVSFGVTVGGSNPPMSGGPVLNASIQSGTGTLWVDGSRIDYQFLMTGEFSSLSSMTFESGSAVVQLLLGSPVYTSSMSNVATPLVGTVTLLGPNGPERDPFYLGTPDLQAGFLYSGSVDDLDLAALLAGGASEVTVHADSDTSFYRPSGTLNVMSVPEPGRMALLMLSFMGWCLRRRREGGVL